MLPYPRPRVSRRLASAASRLTLLAVFGCATPWISIPAPAPASLEPTARLQIWSQRHAVILRDVTITADSVRGRVVDPLGAYSVQWTAIPRERVDSFQLRPPDKANWFGAGVGAGIVGSILVRAAFHAVGSGN